MEVNKIIQGNALAELKKLPSESVSCVMTSPPYWALRDYGTEGIVWDAKEGCEHEWSEYIESARGGHSEDSVVGNNARIERKEQKSDFCKKCGAWKGNLGLEPTFDLFIKHLCDIFDEVKRVLRKDGTCWVNLGDTYYSLSGGKFLNDNIASKDNNMESGLSDANILKGGDELEQKNLCNIPARFSIEMQNRGWILRNVIIWHKPNCMPSSVKDRFTIDFEYLFFFVKNRKYWFEQQLEPHKLESIKRACRARTSDKLDSGQYSTSYKQEYSGYENMMERLENGNIRGVGAGGRNMRTVWTITPKPFSESHFAVYPPELCETPIKAGCPEFICNKCGKPREKIMEPSKEYKKILDENKISEVNSSERRNKSLEIGNAFQSKHIRCLPDYKFKGYSDCGCGADFSAGVVLDPFMGAGTTGLVAKRLGRNYVGIELNPEYIKIAEDSIKSDREAFTMSVLKEIRTGKQKPLFEFGVKND